VSQALDALATYGDNDGDDDDDDDDDNDDNEDEKSRQKTDNNSSVATIQSKQEKISIRIRPSLQVKKSVVVAYYEYIKIKNTDESESANSTKSMRSYVKSYNNKLTAANNEMTLSISNLSKWIKADFRGDYLAWSGINKLHSRTCKAVNIVRHIDLVLKEKFPSHAYYNQVSKSKFMPNEYGIIARHFTPAGTFLGFYNGEVIDGHEASNRIKSQEEYMFALTTNNFIDAKAFDSCFARYYNCALKASDQNVCVERVPSHNPQNVICFIANKDVQKGKEFLISFASAWWKQAAEELPTNDCFFCLMVQNALINKRPENYEILRPLFSTDAPVLAEACLGINSKDM
jgi:hypothetical protein